MKDPLTALPTPSESSSCSKEENLEFVQDNVHSVMMDLAFSNVVARPYWKVSLCLALYLVLALVWAPALKFGMVVETNQTISTQPASRRKILKPPPERLQRSVSRKPASRRVPMPDLHPLDPEPVVEPDPLPAPDVVLADDWEPGFGDGSGEWPKGAGESTGGNVYLAGETGLIPPTFTRRVAPLYPEEAVKTRVQGYVILEAILRKNSQIDNITVIRGLSKGLYGFEREAIDALKKWQFVPGTLKGEPVDVRMTIKIDFILY